MFNIVMSLIVNRPLFSFIVYVGPQKASRPEKLSGKFLMHLEVQMSNNHAENLTLHAGSMQDKAIFWKPHLTPTKQIFHLEIRMRKGGYEVFLFKTPDKP